MAKAAWTASKILRRTFSQDTTPPASEAVVASRHKQRMLRILMDCIPARIKLVVMVCIPARIKVACAGRWPAPRSGHE